MLLLEDRIAALLVVDQGAQLYSAEDARVVVVVIAGRVLLELQFSHWYAAGVVVMARVVEEVVVGRMAVVELLVQAFQSAAPWAETTPATAAIAMIEDFMVIDYW